MSKAQMDTDFLYFRHEWILDKPRVEKLPIILMEMLNAAQQLGTSIAIDRDVRLDGLETLNFTVRVASNDVLSHFVDKIAAHTGFLSWEEIPTSQAMTKTFPDLSAADIDTIASKLGYALIEGAWNQAHRNEELAWKLRFYPPRYYNHDWILTTIDADAWVQKLMESQWRGGSLGSELRFSKEPQVYEHAHAVRIVVRLYSEWELKIFTKEVAARLTSGKWTLVTQEYFAECIPIGRNTSQTKQNEIRLAALIKEIGKLNAE